MTEEKKNILQTFSIGNLITIVIIVFGVVATYTRINDHLSNDDIHLTEAQRDDITKFRTLTEEKLPNIKANENDIRNLEKNFAVFEAEFDFLYLEVDGLESKVSRNYVELREKIENID